MRYPLLLSLFALISGIVLGRWLQFGIVEAVWPAIAIGLLGIASQSIWLRRTCAVFAVAFLGTLTEAGHRQEPPPTIDAGVRETVLLAGCVVEPTQLAPNREQFTLELAAGARAHVAHYLEEDSIPFHLRYGQRVEVEARIRKPRVYRNPGAFDYAAYLARQNVFWTAAVARHSLPRILPGHCGIRSAELLSNARTALSERIESLYSGDQKSAALMQALLIGQASGLEKIWTEDFRRTGTFHALVISGSHVAVLAGLLLLILRLCFVPEILALLLTAMAAWMYAALAGFSPPVVRAAAGFTLYLIARWMFRRGRPLNLLAAVAILFLLIDPGALWDASFQLSFLAVAALGGLATPIADMTFSPFARASRYLESMDLDAHLEPRAAQFRVELRLFAETLHVCARIPLRAGLWLLSTAFCVVFFALLSILVSSAIQIGLALPMAQYFHRVSFTGLSANLAVVPLLELALPAGFLALLTGWHWLAYFAGALVRWSGVVATWHARFEPSWRIADPPLWFAIAFAATLVIFASLVRNRIWRWLAAAMVLSCLVLLLTQPWPVVAAPRQLELTAIDVGQGESLLLMLPEGQRMVVDGGGVLQYGANRTTSQGLDTGEDVVSPYLWSRRIHSIDVLVATHAHTDHTGGLRALLENFHPYELWVGANPPQQLIELARARGVLVRELRAPTAFRFSGTQIEVIAPAAGYQSANVTNNDSLALRIVYGQRSFLLTGDMEAAVELPLLASLPHTDVLKIGHHGSRTSTTRDFLKTVSPSIAIISAGFGNSFGHPHPLVLHRLLERNTTVLRTDRDGLVTVRSDGRLLTYDGMLWHPTQSADNYNWAMVRNGPE